MFKTMNFLNNLDYLLKENKMSRSELARAINVSPSTVNSWFSKSCENVSIGTLKAIANYFNVSLETLINEDNLVTISFTENEYTREELKLISDFGQLLKKQRHFINPKKGENK